MTRKGFQGLTLTGAAGSKALQVLQYRARARKTVRRVHPRVNNKGYVGERLVEKFFDSRSILEEGRWRWTQHTSLPHL